MMLIFIGIGLGRLRVHHKFNPAPRFRSSSHGKIFAQTVRQLHRILYFGIGNEYANTVCRFSAD